MSKIFLLFIIHIKMYLNSSRLLEDYNGFSGRSKQLAEDEDVVRALIAWIESSRRALPPLNQGPSNRIRLSARNPQASNSNSRLAIPPNQNGLPLNHGHRYPAPPAQPLQQAGQRPPKQRRRPENREMKAGRTRSNSRFSTHGFAEFEEVKPMNFVELTDFNDETKSVLSGKASIARSVVSKADTLIFDELLDLRINATPKYQKEMPQRPISKPQPQIQQVRTENRQITRRIRTRSRSRSNEKRPQNAITIKNNGKSSANFKANGHSHHRQQQNGGSAKKPVNTARAAHQNIRKPSVGIRVENRIFEAFVNPTPYNH